MTLHFFYITLKSVILGKFRRFWEVDLSCELRLKNFLQGKYMKRNMELVRKILLSVEAVEAGT
jgi:hypothetical protein